MRNGTTNRVEPNHGWARHRHLVQRLAAIVFLTALLAYLASSDALHRALVDLFETAVELVEGHPVAGPVAFVLFAAVSAMLAFLSSALLVPAALVAWGPLETAALLWIGWVLGGVAAYGAARFLGRPALAFVGSAHLLAHWEDRISRRPPFGLALLFQLAVPSEVPGYVLGLLNYPFRRYLLVLMLGELPFAAGGVLLGESFLERKMTTLVALGALGAVTSLAIYRALQRRLAASAPATATADSAQPGRAASRATR